MISALSHILDQMIAADFPFDIPHRPADNAAVLCGLGTENLVTPLGIGNIAAKMSADYLHGAMIIKIGEQSPKA